MTNNMKNILKGLAVAVCFSALLTSCTKNYEYFNTNQHEATQEQMDRDGLKTGSFFAQMLKTVYVYNDGVKGNMVLLQVTDQRKWYISTDSKLKDITGTNDAVNYMSKAFVTYLSNGDYPNAYKVYATKANDLLDYYAKNGKPVKKEKPFPNEPALVFALFGAFIFTKSIRKSLLDSMSNVNAAVAADAYLDERSFELKDSSDTYMYSNVVAVPRPRGNGHHGGGSGGHGGGGGGY